MHRVPYTLGIDLGSGSLGWAALALDGERARGVLDMGVRIFPSPVDNIETGRDESHAARRRTARLARRQTDRRRRRIGKVYNLLARFGLLPVARGSAARCAAVAALDRELASKHGAHENLVYRLRARALDGRLELPELGRALFHLAQRRGFLSNRKAPGKDRAERPGEVLGNISSLERAISESGSRTLGEYLAGLDASRGRIRAKPTSRKMYIAEFEKIWDQQHRFYPDLLTEERRKILYTAIFHQRPLRNQSGFIGKCGLLAGEKRAPLWHPLAQRFRLLQEANNLRLVDASGRARSLDGDERRRVISRLETGDLPFRELRRLLGLARGVEINLERGGRKSLTGDRTAAALRAVFKHRWPELTAVEKLEAASDLVGDLPEEELAEKAEQRWGLNPLEAKEYASIGLPVSTYAAFSLKAMERLIPRLEEGSDPTTAITAEFPEFYQVEVRETLPPVQKDIRNPAVVRALTELRKVVNGLIRRYGEPQEIHIELARDLKAGKEERERRFQEMRRREAERQAAAERVCRERGGQASRQDIQKWLLAEECRWRCPYTQRGFSAAQLLDSGEIQADHIIPFSRSLDDSFANKTLSYASANAAKGNRSPREAFEGTPGWESILEEVRHFEGPYKRAKLRRFQASSEEIEGMLSEFTSRQLNDTRYASRLAAKYVACLFGGLWDDTGRRVHVSHGQATAYLRRLWALDGLLSDEGRKTREDHRHHAVDAVVIALTGPRWIQGLAEAAVRASREGRRRFASIEAPWPKFVEDVRGRLGSVVVSYRVDRRVGKQMHEKTHYGRIRHPEHGLATVSRKPVHLLSRKEVSAIVDRRVRERVEFQLRIHGGEVKALESDPPTLEARDGRRIPIRTVRIMTAEAPRTVGSGVRARNVVGGDFHHFEIFRRDTKTGEAKYEMRAVSEQMAMERVQAKRPVVNRESQDGAEFVCSIGKADTLEVTTREGSRLVVVQSLEATENRIGFKSLNDARPYSQANHNRERKAIGPLFSGMRCRKVVVSPLGEIRPAND